MTLTIFEILFFSIVDLIAKNFVLAGVLTYILGEVSAYLSLVVYSYRIKSKK